MPPAQRAAAPDRDPLAHLMRMVEQSRLRRKPHFDVAMVWAYFDESAVEEGDPKRFSDLIVGGCFSSQRNWDAFSVAWTDALQKQGVERFHAKDFYGYRGEFKWFDHNGEPDAKRHGDFRDQLADIILEHIEQGIAFVNPARKVKRPVKDAYEKGIVDAFVNATRGHPRPHKPLYIVLARHPELSPWSVLKRFEQVNWEDQLAGCGVFSPEEVIPLQSADFVLHTVKHYITGKETASFLRLRDGLIKRNKTFTTHWRTANYPTKDSPF
jgi:hypothetical protein